MNDRTDKELIRAARDGDEKAFMELVKRYEPRVASTVISMLGNCPEAEDVGQETFIRFYRALGSFRGESGVGTYLTRIAINLSLNELKRRKRRFSLFRKMDPEELDRVPDNKPSMPPIEDREAINWALRKLEPGYRAVLVLRLVNGYSTEETARILKIPVGTVLSRLARGQSKMRHTLKRYLGESQ
jgi:RNA polymerase sigma-70 factor (ECF subfamily)